MIPDDIDGCAVVADGPPVADADLAGIILYADVDTFDLEAVMARRHEWLELFP